MGEIRDINEDINHRIRVGWQNWISASEVICCQENPFRLERESISYGALFYGAEYW